MSNENGTLRMFRHRILLAKERGAPLSAIWTTREIYQCLPQGVREGVPRNHCLCIGGVPIRIIEVMGPQR